MALHAVNMKHNERTETFDDIVIAQNAFHR